MLKHVAKIDKNIKTHFISSNKYFIKPLLSRLEIIGPEKAWI